MKYIKYIIFFFFLFCSTSTVVSQNDVEQLFKDKNYQKVISILNKKDGESNLTLREYFLLTKSYGRNEQYPNGLVYANKMIDECLTLKDTSNLVLAYNLKAENLIDLNQIKPGIEFCESVSSTFRKQDSIAFQQLCFKWGMLYNINKDFQKAFDIYNKITLNKYRKLSLFKNNYAVILEGLGKDEEAISFYKKAIQESNNNNNPALEFSNIAQILLKKGYSEEALKYLDSAENAITEKTPLRSQKLIYENLQEYYHGIGNTFYASIYLDFIYKTNEEIFNKKLTEEIQALKTSYKRETLLNNKLETSRKEKLWGTIILLFIIIALLSILYLFKYRNIKVAHETVLTEQKLLRSQMTPHFIFNSLSVLQGMILNKEDKKAVRYLSKFSKLLRLILENSREKLVPIDEELKAIQNYVDLHNMRSSTSFKYTLTLDEDIEDLGLLIPPMLIQPFIENSIEHGFKKDFENAEITIDIKFNQNKLDCIIKDNGVGLYAKKSKPNKNKKSLSTTITSERLKIFSKEYNVECGVIIQDRSVFNEQGTQINLTLPYKIDQDA